MARQFNGSSHSLQSASAIALSSATVLTVAFWLYWDAFANDDKLCLESSANFNSNDAFIINPDSSSPSGVFVFGLHRAGGYNTRSIARPSAAAWHHYMFIYDSTTVTNMLAYVDGSSVTVTTQTGNNPGSGFGDYTLNVMSRNNASLWGAGRMNGLGIWTSALTSGNASTLAGGTPPASVGSPVAAWNICGTSSPEPHSAGSVDLTVNSATNVADAPSFTGCTAGTGVINPYCLLVTGVQ